MPASGTPVRHTFPVRTLAGVALLIATGGLAGCGSLEAGHAGDAEVRLVATAVDAPPVDLYLDNAGTAYGVSFGTVTSYIPVGAAVVKVSMNRGSTAQTLVQAEAELAPNHRYTAVMSDGLGNLRETIYPDAPGPAPAGSIAVRVLNEVAQAAPLDVYLLPRASALNGSSPAVRALSYLAPSAYLDLPAGQAYVVAVAPAGTLPTAATSVLRGISISGSSGAVRTLVLSGAPSNVWPGVTGFVLDDFDTF